MGTPLGQRGRTVLKERDAGRPSGSADDQQRRRLGLDQLTHGIPELLSRLSPRAFARRYHVSGDSEAMIYVWTFMQRHFPTLLVALPRAVRSLPTALRILVCRLQSRMTRRRVIAGAIVAVTSALIGLAFGLIEERRRRFESVAAEHESKLWYGSISESRTGPPTYYNGNGEVMTTADLEAVDWHKKLAQKYRGAAAKPWLPVEPDPPPP